MNISFCCEALEFQCHFFFFEALNGTKFSSCEQVSSRKYENGYRTKICDSTVYFLLVCCNDESIGCTMLSYHFVLSNRLGYSLLFFFL